MKNLKSYVKVLGCVWILSMVPGCAATQKRESTGQYIDDSVITTKVKTAIFAEDTLKTLQIDVTTFKGVVQLCGFVDSAQSITRAGDVAGHVDGVREVKNNLIMKFK